MIFSAILQRSKHQCFQSFTKICQENTPTPHKRTNQQIKPEDQGQLPQPTLPTQIQYLNRFSNLLNRCQYPPSFSLLGSQSPCHNKAHKKQPLCSILMFLLDEKHQKQCIPKNSTHPSKDLCSVCQWIVCHGASSARAKAHAKRLTVAKAGSFSSHYVATDVDLSCASHDRARATAATKTRTRTRTITTTTTKTTPPTTPTMPVMARTTTTTTTNPPTRQPATRNHNNNHPQP